MLIDGMEVDANHCDDLKKLCVPRTESFFLSSLASWQLAVSTAPLPGAVATQSFEYSTSVATTEARSLSSSQTRELVTTVSESTSFLLQTSVHENAQNCVTNIQEQVKDCPPGIGETIGNALSEGLQTIIDKKTLGLSRVAKDVMEPLAGAGGELVGNAVGAFLGNDCTPTTVSEKVSQCLETGTSETRSSEETNARQQARGLALQELTRIATSVTSEQRTTCSVPAPVGVALWQLELHTPAAEATNTAIARLCVFCMSWGARPTDPPGYGGCGFSPPCRETLMFCPGGGTLTLPNMQHAHTQLGLKRSR